jgi:mannose-6-phosphate isomerase-like protein (cupin superfamily)
MDIKAYIESGILEQYLLGLLAADEANEVARLSTIYPEVKRELGAIEETMERMAAQNAVKPDPATKDKILNVLGLGKNALDINNLPATSRYADHNSWLDAVAHLIPEQPYPGFFSSVLQQTDNLTQMLVVTSMDVPKETHTDIAESFFILKGRCICTVGEKLITLNAGDYLDIPLHIEHDVKIISPHVIAILQHMH